MTRFLADSLEVSPQRMRIVLDKLERANGHPNTDIRFSVAISQDARDKMHLLGLDPKDTSSEELYGALLSRIKADDLRLTRTLQTKAAYNVSAEAKVSDGMLEVLKDAVAEQTIFALKSNVLKILLKKQPPKKAMKALGYRSVDSFLKHEQPIMAVAAAWLTESGTWQRQFIAQYKKLGCKDFELRKLQILQPTSARWQELASSVVSQKKHNLLPFRELGSLIVLPFPKEVPAGATLVSLALALHELNEIRASSTFLKVSQVRSDFGTQIISVVQGQPMIAANDLDQAVPWQLIQRYYARLGTAVKDFRDSVFEPHIELADMAWQSLEQALSNIEPSLEFWHSTGHLAVLHNRTAVSFNILDAALNYCNKLPFEQRMRSYVQHSIWHELTLSYLQHATVEHTVMAQLQPQYALAPALV
jgi:hypothetical protein